MRRSIKFYGFELITSLIISNLDEINLQLSIVSLEVTVNRELTRVRNLVEEDEVTN